MLHLTTEAVKSLFSVENFLTKSVTNKIH